MRWLFNLLILFISTAAMALTPATELLLMNSQYNLSWQWNFAQAGALPSDGSVVDNSPSLGGLVLDASGNLTYAANNQLTYSNTFSNSSVFALLGSTVVGGYSDPVGGSSAWLLAQDATTYYHGMRMNAFTLPVGVNTIVAINIKAGAVTTVKLSDWNNGTKLATFDLSAGTTSGVSGSDSGLAITSPTITPLGGQWYRISVVMTASASGRLPALYLTTGVQYAGTAGNGVYIYSLSMSAVTYEMAPRPGDQVITTASAYYGPKFDYGQGLRIWEARTNLALNSNSLSGWSVYQALDTAAQTTSPDGTVDAASLTATVTTLGDYATYQSATMTASQPYTVSGSFKPKDYNYATVQAKDQAGNTYSVNANIATCAFDSINVQGSPTGTAYTVTPAPNGFCRISVTITNVAVTGSGYGQFCLGNTASPTWVAGCPSFSAAIGSGVYVWGAGIEQGAFPSPTIPTGTATVTAAADLVALTGAPLTTLGGANASLAIEGNAANLAATNALLGINSSAYYLAALASGNGKTNPTAGLSATTAGATTAGANFREAVALASSAASISLNGGAVATGAGASATVTTVQIGSANSANYLNGYVRGLAVYPSTLSSAILKTKSTVGAPY